MEPQDDDVNEIKDIEEQLQALLHTLNIGNDHS